MFQDTMFKVEQEDVFVRNPMWNELNGYGVQKYVPAPNVKALRNTKTNDVLSIMSKDYVPVHDNEVLDKFLTLFQQANIEAVPVKHHITRSKDGVMGRTTFMEVELPAYSLFPNTDELQKLRIVIPNSFDGTRKLKMLLMLWRQICANGMMGWKSEFEFGFKHRHGALDRLGEALNLYLVGEINNVQTVVERLGNMQGTSDAIISYFANNKVLGGERWEERLMGHWLRTGQPTNLWNLYNIFTNEISHNYGRNFGSKISRLEILNHEVKHVWGKVLGVNTDNYDDAILIAA